MGALIFTYTGTKKPWAVVDGNGQSWFSLQNSNNWTIDRYNLGLTLRRVMFRQLHQAPTGMATSGAINMTRMVISPVSPRRTVPRLPTPMIRSAKSQGCNHANGAVTRLSIRLGRQSHEHDRCSRNVTTYTYDSTFNQVTSLTDPNGRVTTYQYDSRGNRTNETDPLLDRQSWTYDSHGNVISATDRNVA